MEELTQVEIYHLRLVLQILESMTFGHNEQLQNEMREQLNNKHSVNIVKEVAVHLNELASSFIVDAHSIELLTQCCATLLRFVSGNLKNQQVCRKRARENEH